LSTKLVGGGGGSKDQSTSITSNGVKVTSTSTQKDMEYDEVNITLNPNAKHQGSSLLLDED
jgi:hypothetical protein